MTAKQLSARSKGEVVHRDGGGKLPPATLGCNHNSISPGLDHVQCKNCHREWPRWHPDYERLLNQPSIVTPEQTDCSGVTPIPLTPEQTHCSGVTPIPLTPEQPHCSGVTSIPLTPEQTHCSGVTPIPLTPEQPHCSGVTSIPLTPEQPHWIETYSPSNRKQYSYYRYMWMEGQKMRHIHIPGGNIKSSRALAHFEKVERAIADSWWPSEIEELIKSFKLSVVEHVTD